jgi:hypothetical protein
MYIYTGRLENHFEAYRLIEGADAALESMQAANALEKKAKDKRLFDAALMIQNVSY